MEQIRIAVRTLVEFTLHGADIRRVGGQIRDMHSPESGFQR